MSNDDKPIHAAVELYLRLVRHEITRAEFIEQMNAIEREQAPLPRVRDVEAGRGSIDRSAGKEGEE